MNFPALLIIVISTIFGAFGTIFLKKGSANINKKITSYLFNKLLIMGILLYICSVGIYIFALSKIELSYAYPISALGYIWVILLSKYYLNEKISKTKMISISLIIIGIIILTL